MNKRSTEGYVLTYLLIVITIMGVIAATLMTSTLQVIQSQEKSVIYMQEKYEAMGAVERFVAELDHVTYQHTHPSGKLNFYTDDRERCLSDAAEYLWTTLLPTLSLDYPTLEVGRNSSSPDDALDIICSLPDHSSKIIATLSFTPEITTPYEEQIVKEIYPDPETGDTQEREVLTTCYSYSIDLTNIIFESYTIISAGGDAE